MKEEKLEQLKIVFGRLIEDWLSTPSTLYEDYDKLVDSLLIEVKIRIN